MPVIKGSKKALRRDRRRTIINKKVREAYKEAVRLARQKPTPENLQKAYSELDRAAKKNVIHKNKAARLKSRLAKLLVKKGVRETPAEKKEVRLPKPKRKAKKSSNISKSPSAPKTPSKKSKK